MPQNAQKTHLKASVNYTIFQGLYSRTLAVREGKRGNKRDKYVKGGWDAGRESTEDVGMMGRRITGRGEKRMEMVGKESRMDLSQFSHRTYATGYRPIAFPYPLWNHTTLSDYSLPL